MEYEEEQGKWKEILQLGINHKVQKIVSIEASISNRIHKTKIEVPCKTFVLKQNS